MQLILNMSKIISVTSKIFLILIVLFSGPACYAQQNLPIAPEIKYVSIDKDNGFVHMEWDASPSANIESYIMSTVRYSGPHKLTATYFDTVPGNVLHYAYHPDTPGSRMYVVIALDTFGNESLIGNDFHKPVSLEIKYDSCSSSMLLSWDNYIGWNNQLSGYRVFYRNGEDENSDFMLLERTDTSHLSAVQMNVTENEHYEYLIEAFTNQELTSTSNKISYFTYMPKAPDFVNLDYVSVLDERTLEISFSADISGEINDFRVSRSTSPSGSFSTVETFLDLSTPTVYLTDNVATQGEKFYYRIEALNSCLNPILNSNQGNNIIVRGESKESEVSLEWDAYEQFSNGIAEYEIYRKDASGFFEKVASVPASSNSYREDIMQAGNRQLRGRFSYLIKAIENGQNPLGITGISNSNEVEVDVETRMFMPNAFTPNNDGNNDVFMPILDFIPRDYKMLIFDRSGKNLFSSTDPNLGWDGSLNGSGKAREGVYIYHIEYLSYNGVRQIKTGNLTLVYP